MKKLIIISLSAGVLILGAIVIKAQAAFQGPPPGCANPGQTGCNLDGVIWNRAITAPQAQNASFYITGNTRTGGTARVGSGLTIDSGGANITGYVQFISGGSLVEIKEGDVYINSNKAIRVDHDSASTLNIGNWGGANLPVNVNILGTLNVTGNDTWTQSKITSREYCIGTSCITSWPSGGGGGGGTVTSVGSGDGLTGGPITGSGTLNVGAGTGISVTANAVNLNTTYTDGRYFVRNQQLDNNASIYSRSGKIGATDSGGGNSNYPYLDIGGGLMGYYENTGYWSVSPAILFKNSVSMLGGSVSIGQGNSATLQIVGQTTGNTNINIDGTISRFCISSSAGTCTSWGGSYGSIRGDRLCIGADCRSSWPSGGATLPSGCSNGQVAKWNGSTWTCANDANSGGDITAVSAGTGLTGGGTSGDVTLGLAPCPNGQIYKSNGTSMVCQNDAGGLTSINVGAGLNVSNPSGPTPTLSISPFYQLPQTGCSSGQILQKTASGWGCTAGGTGTLTGIISGAGISVTNPNGPQPQISVNYTTLDSRYAQSSALNSYVPKTGNSTISGGLTVTDTINLSKSGTVLYAYNQEALWFNGTYFSWGYGGSANYFARNVGIGVTNPTYQLQLSQNSAAKPTSGTWTIASDIRLKDVHGDFTKGLDEISKLKPIYYTYKKDNIYNYPSDIMGVGFSAQEVEKYIPEAVKTDDNGYLQIEADAIYWAMLNSIKELKSQNEELRAKNQDLEQRLKRLEALMSTILQ